MTTTSILRAWVPAPVAWVQAQLVPAAEAAAPAVGPQATTLRLRRAPAAVHADVATSEGVLHLSLSPWDGGTAVEAHVIAATVPEQRLLRVVADRLTALPLPDRPAPPDHRPPVTAAATGRDGVHAVTGTV